MVLEKDILLDRKDARSVRYLSGGKECAVHAVAADSGQSPRTLLIEKGLLGWVCLIFLPITGRK